jgi:hypothetical protein
LPNSLRKMTRNSFSTSSSLFKSPTASICLPVLLWGRSTPIWDQHELWVRLIFTGKRFTHRNIYPNIFLKVQFLSVITFNVWGLYFGLRKFSQTHYRTVFDKLRITSWIFRISTLKIICSSIEQVG